MKHLLLACAFVYSYPCVAQGMFAGSLKSFIGKNYSQEKDLSFLQGYTSRGGTLLSKANDPDKFTVSWYSNRTSIIAIFETVSDNNQRQILDILKIENVGPGQELKIGDCKDGDNESITFMALVKTSKAERWKAIKAWHCNRDKIRIEAWPAANVTCLGMVGDD